MRKLSKGRTNSRIIRSDSVLLSHLSETINIRPSAISRKCKTYSLTLWHFPSSSWIRPFDIEGLSLFCPTVGFGFLIKLSNSIKAKYSCPVWMRHSTLKRRASIAIRQSPISWTLTVLRKHKAGKTWRVNGRIYGTIRRMTFVLVIIQQLRQSHLKNSPEYNDLF